LHRPICEGSGHHGAEWDCAAYVFWARGRDDATLWRFRIQIAVFLQILDRFFQHGNFCPEPIHSANNANIGRV
jgi:hypothetical protein